MGVRTGGKGVTETGNWPVGAGGEQVMGRVPEGRGGYRGRCRGPACECVCVRTVHREHHAVCVSVPRYVCNSYIYIYIY